MLTFERHAFRQFESELKLLLSTLSSMAEIISGQLNGFGQGLGDAEAFKAAKQKDKQLNSLEFEVDRLVADILAKYSPTGDELRFVITSIKISAALELMGDITKNSVKHVSKLSSVDDAKRNELKKIASLLHQNLNAVMPLISAYDQAIWKKAYAENEQIESISKNFIFALGDAVSDPEMKRHLFLVAKNLERIGDLALDIAKYCHYIHTGQKFEKQA